MSQFDHQWQKLAALTRQASDDRDTAAPFGFAGRVVAQAAGSYGFTPWAALERFALRGFVAAAACCVAAVAFNFLGWNGETSIEALEDAVNSTSLDLS